MRAAVASTFAALLLAAAAPGHAYVQTTTCASTCDDLCGDARDGVCQDGGDGSVAEATCNLGSDCTDCGYRADPNASSSTRCRPGEVPLPVAWQVPCTSYFVNVNGAAEIPDFEGTVDAIRAAFDTWNAVDCSFFHAEYGGTTDENRPGYSSCGDNVNFVGFIEEDWNRPGYPANALALTSVTFDLRDGTIVDADIELNSANFVFDLLDDSGDPAATQDVRNVVTHEAGHFFGLDHTRGATHVGEETYLDATMTDRAPAGDITKRDLLEDDIAGLCAIYPLDAPLADARCRLPRERFLAAPADAPGEECAGSTNVRTRRQCSSAPNGGPFAFGLLALLVLIRRR